MPLSKRLAKELRSAAVANDLPRTRKIINELKLTLGSYPIAADGHADGALQHAAACASVDVICELLVAKADPSVRDSYGRSAMEEVQRYLSKEKNEAKRAQYLAAADLLDLMKSQPSRPCATACGASSPLVLPMTTEVQDHSPQQNSSHANKHGPRSRSPRLHSPAIGLACGARVRARWTRGTQEFSKKFYLGTILKTNQESSYDIAFDDGSMGRDIPAKHVQLVSSESKEASHLPGRSQSCSSSSQDVAPHKPHTDHNRSNDHQQRSEILQEQHDKIALALTGMHAEAKAFEQRQAEMKNELNELREAFHVQEAMMKKELHQTLQASAASEAQRVEMEKEWVKARKKIEVSNLEIGKLQNNLAEANSQAAKQDAAIREAVQKQQEVAQERDRAAAEAKSKDDTILHLEQDLARIKKIKAECIGASHGVQWQYFAGGTWSSMPAESNNQLHKAYILYKSEGCADTQKIEIRSGGNLYKVDLLAMTQTNVQTGMVRNIRVQCEVPSSWTKQPQSLLHQLRSSDVLVSESSDMVHDAIINLLRKSCHSSSSDHPDSKCCLMEHARIHEIRRVENFSLWRKYVQNASQMEMEQTRDGLIPLEVPVMQCRSPDLDIFVNVLRAASALPDQVCEQWLFHGTSYKNAGKIVMSGFEHRLAKTRAMYGQGTYFASQSCKSHQYTCNQHWAACDCRKQRTVILARVALGQPFYATQVDKTMRIPPFQQQGARRHDSVIARTGPMSGHQRGFQDHDEFIVFDSTQAYPAFVITYSVR